MSEIDFRPDGPVRPNSLYVSWPLFKALGYVARKTGRTREDVAEMVLNSFVATEHPDIVAWMDKRQDEEKEFLKGLKQ